MTFLTFNDDLRPAGALNGGKMLNVDIPDVLRLNPGNDRNTQF